MDSPVRRHLVYSLIDPVSNEMRYIGKSSSGLNRPRKHGWFAGLKNDDGSYVSYKHLHNWIRSIGFNYEVCVLEEFDRADDVRDRLNDAERFWIAYFRYVGARLLNVTDGGDGDALPGVLNPFYGKKHKPKTIEVNRQKHTGSNNVGYGKPGTMLGRKHKDESRIKMRGPRPSVAGKNHPMFGKKHSAETIEKISARGRGRKHSAETKAKQSAARKAYWERRVGSDG